jgi:hypothetical protein
MKTKLVIFLVAVSAPLALGHHSTIMYNMGNPTTLEGTVKSFDWINPHSLLHLEVPNSEGKPRGMGRGDPQLAKARVKFRRFSMFFSGSLPNEMKEGLDLRGKPAKKHHHKQA